jgi:putative PIN family toxin of toxin-antitoxin system
MRAVADTNTVVSGLLWRGAPWQVLDAARAGKVELFTSAALLAELEEVLEREKFARRLERAGVTARELVLGYAALARLVEPVTLPPVIREDPDDDAVLACAVAAQAEAIVSGDGHLLNLKAYQRMPILTAAQLAALIPTG